MTSAFSGDVGVARGRIVAVRRGRASQHDFCPESRRATVLSEWVRARQLLSLEDTVRHLVFQPARIMGLCDRG